MMLTEYAETVCDQLDILHEDIVGERVTGDGKKETLVSSLRSLKKFCVMNEIDKTMPERNAFQGAKYK